MNTIPKLPKAFKRKWIAALRSGKFIKGTGQLKTYDAEKRKTQYCCLGVACEIVGARIYRPSGSYIDSGNVKGIKKIPTILHGDNDVTSSLAFKNDHGYSFKKIANWIEKHL